MERARLSQEKVVNQREDLARGISLEVTNARATLAAAQDRLSVTKDNVALAERIYETFLAENPSQVDDPELLAAYANYLVAVGRHAEAERLFRQLISADPSDVDLHNGYAEH